MGFSIKNNTRVAIKEEGTEGTYEVPAAAGDYISPLADGVTLEPTKELLERNNLTNSIGKSRSRVGMKSVSVTLPCEAKASDTEGDAPEYGLLVEGALGATRSFSEATSGTGHTTTVINYDGDGYDAYWAVGDTVLIKESGAYHLSPITAVDTSANTLTLLVAADSSPSDSVTIAAGTTYYTANGGHPAISVTKFTTESGASWVREDAIGCKVTNMSMNGFSTGQLLEWSFGLEGLSFNRQQTSTGLYTPDFDDSLPPIALQACIYIDGTQIDVNNVSWSVDNTLGFVMSTCNENGKISARITERTITGSLDPYKTDTEVANYTRFNDNTQFSLFGYAYNPTSTTGEFEQCVAFYMPNCIITSISESDQDGILQDSLNFQATRGTDGTSEELYVTFI